MKTRTVKHPRQLGFTLAFKVRLNSRDPKLIDDAVAKVRDAVYVAIPSEGDDRLFINKGYAVRVGQVGGTVLGRWRGILGIFGADRKLRENEKSDRDKLKKAVGRKELSIWVRKARDIAVPYAKGLTKKNSFSTRWAEEVFLDEYYRPSVGMRLKRESQ
jgi:hypothetical protein